LNYYQRALLALGKRTEANEQIWDSVNWELSTTCFNMAVILQDYPDNRAKVRKSENFQNSLVISLLSEFGGAGKRGCRTLAKSVANL